MKKYLAIAIFLLPTFAYGQEKEFELKVNQADIQLLGKALGELPFKDAAPLMQKLQLQINQQNQPKPEAKPIEAPKPN